MADKELDETIPISLVVQYAYCPRRAWLELQGEQTDTYQMQVGYDAHRLVDSPASHGTDEVRAIEIRSTKLGVSGKVDAIKVDGGKLRIREYKATPVRKVATVTRGMRVQLALQKKCLEEMGNEVDATEIYFVNHKQIVEVSLTEEDYEVAHDYAAQVRELLKSDYSPEPLEDTTRCVGCSHADVHRMQPVERRIRASMSDGRVVYLTTAGSYAHLRKGRMVIDLKKEELAQIPLETVQAVQVHGNVTLSGGLIRELLERDIPIEWCTSYGRLSGWSMPSWGPNGSARNLQHVLSQEGSLLFASEFVAAKIANQATQIRRAGADDKVVGLLRQYQQECYGVHNLTELLGVERTTPASVGVGGKERKASDGRHQCAAKLCILPACGR